MTKGRLRRNCPRGISADAIVTSGGVSIGRHDLVKQALSNLGMELVFWKVAMKPGKPFLFGMLGQKPVFGLPGNPGAATISFEQFVRPALLRMMGHQELLRPVAEAELAGESVARSDRVHFIRCRLEVANGVLKAWVIPKLKPAMIRTTVAVDGLIVVEPGEGSIEPGERVTVQILKRPPQLTRGSMASSFRPSEIGSRSPSFDARIAGSPNNENRMEDRLNGNLKVKSKVWLENGLGNTVIGDGRFRILKAIRDTGSISKAAVRIKQPFRRVWARVKDAEEQCGFKLVERSEWDRN